MIQLQLSPETPLARDGDRATRSVARAGTTHHLATGLHQTKEYFPARPLSKGKALQNLDASDSKK
jgi:squalene cyclase